MITYWKRNKERENQQVVVNDDGNGKSPVVGGGDEFDARRWSDGYEEMECDCVKFIAGNKAHVNSAYWRRHCYFNFPYIIMSLFISWAK